MIRSLFDRILVGTSGGKRGTQRGTSALQKQRSKLALERLEDRLTLSVTPTQVQFSQADYVIGENGGSATITVTRTGDTTGVTTVDFSTVDETAVAGVNYDTTQGTLVFNPGDTQQTFTVTVHNDGKVLGNTSVGLALNNVVDPNASFGTQDAAQLTIKDQSGTANQRYVESLYLETLYRHSDPGGMAFWKGVIDRSQLTRTQVALLFETCHEARQQQVLRFYYGILGRGPTDVAVYNQQVKDLETGKTTQQSMMSDFYGSDEYYGQPAFAPLPGEGSDPTAVRNMKWLESIYQDLLGRNATQSEATQAVPATAAGRANLVFTILNGTTAADNAGRAFMVKGFYEDFLDREPDASATTFINNLFIVGGKNGKATQTMEQVQAALLGSNEYFSK